MNMVKGRDKAFYSNNATFIITISLQAEGNIVTHLCYYYYTMNLNNFILFVPMIEFYSFSAEGFSSEYSKNILIDISFHL